MALRAAALLAAELAQVEAHAQAQLVHAQTKLAMAREREEKWRQELHDAGANRSRRKHCREKMLRAEKAVAEGISCVMDSDISR